MQWDTVLFSLSECLRAEDFVLAELQHAPFFPSLTLRVAELNACHRRCRQALEAAGEPADPALRSLCSRYHSSLHALAPMEIALASGLEPEQAAQEAQARREKQEAARSAGQQSPSGQKRPVANMTGVLERLKEMCPMYAEDVATEGKAAADAKFERVFKSTKIKRSALDKVVRSNKGKGKA